MLFPRLDASFARIGQLSARSTARSGHGRKHVKAGPRRPRRAPSLDAGAWRATVIAPRGNDVIGRGRDRPKKSTDNRRSGVSRNPCHHLVESRYPPPTSTALTATSRLTPPATTLSRAQQSTAPSLLFLTQRVGPRW